MTIGDIILSGSTEKHLKCITSIYIIILLSFICAAKKLYFSHVIILAEPHHAIGPKGNIGEFLHAQNAILGLPVYDKNSIENADGTHTSQVRSIRS